MIIKILAFYSFFIVHSAILSYFASTLKDLQTFKPVQYLKRWHHYFYLFWRYEPLLETHGNEIDARVPGKAKLTRLSFYYLLPGEFFLLKFIGRFKKCGLPVSQNVVENFYRYFKYTYRVDSLAFLPDLFFQAYELPFKVNSVTLSNRSYQFPDTFKSEREWERLVVKKIGSVLNKRSEQFFLGKFFAELIEYLNGSSLSVLRQFLDSVFLLGLENRAFVHYRWMVRAKA